MKRVRSSLRKHLRNQKSDRKALLPGAWAAAGWSAEHGVRNEGVRGIASSI